MTMHDDLEGTTEVGDVLELRREDLRHCTGHDHLPDVLQPGDWRRTVAGVTRLGHPEELLVREDARRNEDLHDSRWQRPLGDTLHARSVRKRDGARRDWLDVLQKWPGRPQGRTRGYEAAWGLDTTHDR